MDFSSTPGSSNAFKTLKESDSQTAFIYPAQPPRIAVIQSLSHVQLFSTPWTAARQASLSFIISQSLLKLMSIELMMLSNHPILCRLGGNRHVEWCVVSGLYLSHALSQKATEGCAQSKREVKAIKRRKRILRTHCDPEAKSLCSLSRGPSFHPRSRMPELKILMLQLKVPHITTKSRRSLRQQLRPSSAE